MKASTCSFNPGVIIANLTEWRNQNITQQLQHWMELNTQYVSCPGETMGLRVFLKSFSSLIEITF